MLRLTYFLILLFVSCSTFVFAQEENTENNSSSDKPVHEYAIDLYGATSIRIAARQWMLQRGKTDVVPALIRSLRYFPEDSSQTLHLLRELTQQDSGPLWHDWVLWMQDNPTEPFAKNELFIKTITKRIDKNFQDFFHEDIQRSIRLDEIVWGGVRKDGIPALTYPFMTAAKEADYISKDELVFGISINGDTRAYPYRFMDWHEMLNDMIGGVSVSLAYCTLCGSGILYKTKITPDEDPLIFGSSGFLYRSNKLMYDQKTHSLWNQFNGKPVVGSLVQNDIELEVLPLVTTTWGEWLAQHPDTKIMSSETGFKRDYTPGAAYGAYFFSDELMFPASVKDDSLKQKDKVFGLRISGANKAWPLKLFEQTKVINDQVGIIPIVLIGDAKTETVRAYRSEGKKFQLSKNGQLIADKQEWQQTENELIGPKNQKLSRLPGHVAYWFAWSGYFPETLAKKPPNLTKH
ncbi:MAG: DUF3179 domain-containing protein [Gammaproteobacteria bacterium]|nr:MAG: DUF3179 domain-containing protein [Gammaproteobacteria bacterium]